ncbi:MAG: thioredoxin family protein [bacterium]|nr:thioredoxin family protein [bacterium]
MVHVALAFMMAVVGTSEGNSLEYEAAFAKAQREQKPLLILVGARWCASCQIMKKETIQPMKQSGALDDVVVTFVDKDDRPELAEKLMKGQTLPQIVVFTKNTGNWKRFSLTGMQSPKRMAELLGRATGQPQSEVIR